MTTRHYRLITRGGLAVLTLFHLAACAPGVATEGHPTGYAAAMIEGGLDTCPPEFQAGLTKGLSLLEARDLTNGSSPSDGLLLFDDLSLSVDTVVGDRSNPDSARDEVRDSLSGLTFPSHRAAQVEQTWDSMREPARDLVLMLRDCARSDGLTEFDGLAAAVATRGLQELLHQAEAAQESLLVPAGMWTPGYESVGEALKRARTDEDSKDSDGDGVPDNKDAHPDDPDRRFADPVDPQTLEHHTSLLSDGTPDLSSTMLSYVLDLTERSAPDLLIHELSSGEIQ